MCRVSSLRVRAKPRHLPYVFIYIYVCARWGGPESCPTHADVMRGPHSWRKRSGGSYVSCDGSWQLGIIHQVKPTCDPNRVVTLTVVITCAEDNAMVERHIQTAIAVTIINMRPGSWASSSHLGSFWCLKEVPLPHHPRPPTFVRLPPLLCLVKTLPESENAANLILVILTISKLSEISAIFGWFPLLMMYGHVFAQSL